MRRLLLLTLGVAGLLLAAIPSAGAHTGLVEGSPGPGDEVAPGSRVLALRFEAIDPEGEMRIAVLDADDEPLPVGGARAGNDGLACAGTAPLNPGVHTVEYTVTGGDGHTIRGRYVFEVVTGAEPAADLGCDPTALPPPDADAGSLGFDVADLPPALLVGLGVLVVASGVLAAVQVRRSRRGPARGEK